MRVSPHLYNTPEDMQALSAALTGRANHRNTGAQEHRSTGAQEYRTVQECRSTGVRDS